jgi:hypothetical protein
LFEPEKPVQSETPAAPAPGAPPDAPASAEKPPAQGEGSTTGRLLDAKRRAQKRTDRE